MTRPVRCCYDGTSLQDFSIRPSREEDASALYELEQRVFGEDAYSTESFRRLLADSNIKVFVAIRNGEIQGYGAVTIQRARETLRGDFRPLAEAGLLLFPEVRVGYLKSLAVKDDASARRRGIGTALIQKRLNWLERQGIEHVFCYAWPKGNFWTLAKRMGFQQIHGWAQKRYNDGSMGTLCHRRLASVSMKPELV